MKTSEIIALLAGIIAVVGWFVNSWLNRRHEISKRRLEHRLDALRSFIPLFFTMKSENWADPEFGKMLSLSRQNFQLYCHPDEINAFELMVSTIEARNNEAFTVALRNLINIVRDGVRSELGLKLYKPNKDQSIDERPPHMTNHTTDKAMEHYDAYNGYAKDLRTWLIAYGVGISLLILGNKEVIQSLTGNDLLKPILIMGLIYGICAQITLAAINKYANWLIYYTEENSIGGWRKSFPNWISNQIWIDMTIDFTATLAFASSTLALLRIIHII